MPPRRTPKAIFFFTFNPSLIRKENVSVAGRGKWAVAKSGMPVTKALNSFCVNGSVVHWGPVRNARNGNGSRERNEKDKKKETED